MAEVNWINGNIEPTESGEYYLIIEAQHDIGDFKKGDVEITSEYYDTQTKEWDSIGKDNPTWKVLSWAKMLRPNIPKDLQKRTKWYFGKWVGDIR